MERKLATVLFVDLVESTELVSGMDPEVVRRRVNTFFERAARCIERHGGLVEKFAGDAVMAAFGVPRAHEDDVERALRAAFDVMDVVHDMGLEARAGVEAGEVVVEASESTFATGEAVTLAARLQQSAPAGAVVIGPGARRLTRGAADLEEMGPLEIRGRSERLMVWRVRQVRDARRTAEPPFVGRRAELDLLWNTYARSVRDRRAHLVTIVGEPGVGKSRLVSEFVAGLQPASILTGRTLPYGEGVTFWPLASMIRAAAGIRDDDPADVAFRKLRDSCGSEAVAERLAVVLGLPPTETEDGSPDDLAWAALRWVERLTDDQPLVLVFEDLHWAGERLLDLIHHLVTRLRRAPLVVLCVSRPELYELRPAWGGGTARSLGLDLGPLPRADAERLAASLLGDGIAPARRAVVLEKAEGNPLFLLETAQMLARADDRPLTHQIPDTVQALIAARIDALEPGVKRLLQHAAVIGRVFWRGALDALTGGDVDGLFDALVERELVLPEDGPTPVSEQAFRFSHGLVREVAYAGISKAQRAGDHRAFADWLAAQAVDELADIRAYHLDRAAALMAELDGAVPADLSREAAAELEAAGRRALRRGAYRSARQLLARARDLEPSATRTYLAADAAWKLSDIPAAREEALALLDDARAAQNRGLEGRALVILGDIALHRDSDSMRARNLGLEALATLPLDDATGRWDAETLMLQIGWWVGDGDECQRRGETLRRLAVDLKRADLECVALTHLASVASVRDDLRGARALHEQARRLADSGANREAIAFALATSAGTAISEKDLERAEAEITQARAIYDEIGAAGRHAWATIRLGVVKAEQGDPGKAERHLREAVRELEATLQHGFLVEAERTLAEILVELGDLTEAERFASAARRDVGHDDVWTQASAREALAHVREAQGRPEQAHTLLREAADILEPTMYRRFATRVRAQLEAVGDASEARA